MRFYRFRVRHFGRIVIKTWRRHWAFVWWFHRWRIVGICARVLLSFRAPKRMSVCEISARHRTVTTNLWDIRQRRVFCPHITIKIALLLTFFFFSKYSHNTLALDNVEALIKAWEPKEREREREKQEEIVKSRESHNRDDVTRSATKNYESQNAEKKEEQKRKRNGSNIE